MQMQLHSRSMVRTVAVAAAAVGVARSSMARESIEVEPPCSTSTTSQKPLRDITTVAGAIRAWLWTKDAICAVG